MRSSLAGQSAYPRVGAQRSLEVQVQTGRELEDQNPNRLRKLVRIAGQHDLEPPAWSLLNLDQ
jgi:hypothetical protein